MAPEQSKLPITVSSENTVSAASALAHNELTDANYRVKLALRNAVLPQNQMTQGQTASPVRGESALAQPASDVVAIEVLCARLFNTPIPQDIPKAVDWLVNAIKECCQVNECVLFLYDDERDLYLCVNDDNNPELSEPRKLSQLGDNSLNGFISSPDNSIHGHLLHGQELLGLVAIANKTDGSPLDSNDELRLDILGPYLAATLVTYRQLKANLQLGRVQRTVLDISSRLIKAVDQENVLSIALEAFGQQLGFDMCQYIQRLPNTDDGEVLLEFTPNHDKKPSELSTSGAIKSMVHAGLASKRKKIRQFNTLLGLFKSIARQQPYLLLPGNTMGDASLKQRFHLPLKQGQAVHSSLILPVLDPASGRIRGTLNLYRMRSTPIEQATLEMAQEMIGLVSLALSRVMVLEMALEMASTDELTGLTNRRGFYDRFEAEIERARRVGSPICTAMLDVDFFKKINDTYGHLNGDAILHQLGQAIKGQLRKSDMVCRFGGEEFALLLPDTKFDDAVELLERIRAHVAKKALNGLDGITIPVTISAGLSKVSLPDKTAAKSTIRPHAIISNALEQADKQLYLAKQQGRNKVCATCE